MKNLLEDNIKFLKGVGEKRASILEKELNIITFEDLLYHFPYRYIDRTKFYKIRELNSKLPYVQVKGKIVKVVDVGMKKGQRLIASFADETGTVDLVWFKGIHWIKDKLSLGREYIVFGTPSVYNRKINIVHPEIEVVEDAEAIISSSMQAFYSTTEQMKNRFVNSKAIAKLQENLLERVKNFIPETLPSYLIKEYKLMPRKAALLNIHFPQNAALLRKAQFRLKFEELFYIQLNILKSKFFRKKDFEGHKFPVIGQFFNTYYKKHLPFELTHAQKRVLKEIRKDVGSGKQMNRLLQGDVGSGKTMVALLSMLMALDNGFQVCLMAPTEILSVQHLQTFSDTLKEMKIKIALLTGSTKTKERKVIHELLENGSLHILIGTHALIEDVVQFKKLGLVIIDEQHRFGVAQRAKLWKKSTVLPHILVMTATPIPRTLAMTLYGDLDVSVIDELPPQRKPVETVHIFENQKNKIYKFLQKQLKAGRQVYFVYPLIQESEKLDYKNLEVGFEEIQQIFPCPQYAVNMVHGRMKPAEKETEMQKFVEGKTQILVATTVIEVGVDVPNASVMVIESCERFGLSQLHQLRGRVGRGADQSFCILISSYKLSSEAKKRIETMVSTNDGFKIAEIDLQLRGPGNIEGLQQSGIPFHLKIANLGKDSQILQYARDICIKILNKDPKLKHSENLLLLKQLKKLSRSDINWSFIS